MPESKLTDLGRRYDHPGYRAIWRTVLKTQIKQLVEQLSYYAGEEAILLSASLNEGTLSHIGSESGEVFLSTHEKVKKQFLGFCLNRHKKPRLKRDEITGRQRQDSNEPSNDISVTIKDKTVEGFTHDRTVSVSDAVHIQTSAENEKHQTANPDKAKTPEEHRQDSSETSKGRTVTIIDNVHAQTSAEHKKHQSAIIDGMEYIQEEHSYIAEKDSSKSGTSSIEDLDVTSESDFDSDEEMLDDSDEEMLVSKKELMNSKRKVSATAGRTKLIESPDTNVDRIKVLDEEDSVKEVCESIEMTCDEIPADSDINFDKIANSETLVIVKDESDSDVSVGEPQEGTPGTSKDSTHDSRDQAAVGVYRNGKIRWATSDSEEKYSRRTPKQSVKRKYQPETEDTQYHTISDLKEKYSRQPRPCKVKGKRHMSLLSTKYHAILEVEKGRKMIDVAREYKLRRSTLSGWVKIKDKIKALYSSEEYGPNRRKMITLRYPDVDRAMRDWVQDAKINSIPVSYVLMIDKANEFARDLGYTKKEFTCSHGWVERFRERHGLCVKGRQKHAIRNKSGLMKKTDANIADTDQKVYKETPRISCQHDCQKNV